MLNIVQEIKNQYLNLDAYFVKGTKRDHIYKSNLTKPK